ncbi:hypothetical protein BM536_005325 [Streptomyces phaeoluteigriseus]|uniref:Uncharacterized protein n=1 Tax=Streptomyces phaeoluteigriseus TaxID=114686 RepID=A0A1V6MYF1_9ACTN|nr:hypothetical protein [Streptomyces phaeoluteigriseus]OQD57385.1 hypothetical protein BM536_005325 [Streptomyces phaeoluteigriseus]
MERVNAYLGKHLWLQFVLSILCASALVMLLYPGHSALSVVLRTALISISGIVVVLIGRSRERRAAGGSTNSLVSLDRKLRKGEVPVDPSEREAMRALVTQRLHRTRHRVAALVLLAVLFCAVTVLTALTSGLRQTIGFALLTGIFLVWIIGNGNLQHRRLRVMQAALDGDSTSARAQRNGNQQGGSA